MFGKKITLRFLRHPALFCLPKSCKMTFPQEYIRIHYDAAFLMKQSVKLRCILFLLTKSYYCKDTPDGLLTFNTYSIKWGSEPQMSQVSCCRVVKDAPI